MAKTFKELREQVKNNTPKPVNKPSLSQRLSAAGKSFNNKMDSASNVARGAVHAGLSRPKEIGHAIGKVAGTSAGAVSTASKAVGTVASKTSSATKSVNQFLHKTGGEFK